jgi:hypothetical protein
MPFLIRRGMPTHHAYRETKQTSLNYERRQHMSRELTRGEMDFSMTTEKPVEQVKATDMVIMTVLTIIQTTICPTTVEVSLQVQV